MDILVSIPGREEKDGLVYLVRMHVLYPQKGVIRVFVDTFSKINRILFVF